jgi:hypothetical protein
LGVKILKQVALPFVAFMVAKKLKKIKITVSFILRLIGKNKE